MIKVGSKSAYIEVHRAPSQPSYSLFLFTLKQIIKEHKVFEDELPNERLSKRKKLNLKGTDISDNKKKFKKQNPNKIPFN